MPLSSMKKIICKEGFEIVKVSVADALPTSEASVKLGLWYAISDLVYRAVRINISPSALIVARKK